MTAVFSHYDSVIYENIGLYLGQVGEDVEAGLGDGDVHGVFGADVDGSSRFRNINEVVTWHGAFILNWVVLHLHDGNEWNTF